MDVDIDRPPLAVSTEDEVMEYEDDHSHIAVTKLEEAVMEDPHRHAVDGDEVMDEGFIEEAHGEGEGMEAEPTPPLKVENSMEFPLTVPTALNGDFAPTVTTIPGSTSLAADSGPLIGTGAVDTSAEAGPSQSAPTASASVAAPTVAREEVAQGVDGRDVGALEEEYHDEAADAEHAEFAEGEQQGADETEEEDEIPRIDSSSLPSILLHLPFGTRSLFTSISNEGEAGPSQPSKIYLEGRESILAEASLLDVWTEIRSEIVSEGGNVVGEMVVEERQMELQMGEDDINIQATTLLEFLQVYLDCDLPTPIELHVKLQPSRFVARYNAIQQELATQAEQRKLRPARLEDEHDEVGGEGEYEEYEEDIHDDGIEGDENENEGNDEDGEGELNGAAASPVLVASERKDEIGGGEPQKAADASNNLDAATKVASVDATQSESHVANNQLDTVDSEEQAEPTQLPEDELFTSSVAPAALVKSGSTDQPIVDAGVQDGDVTDIAATGEEAIEEGGDEYEEYPEGDGGEDEGDPEGEGDAGVVGEETQEELVDGLEVEVAGVIGEENEHVDQLEEGNNEIGEDEEEDPAGGADFDVDKLIDHVDEQDAALDIIHSGDHEDAENVDAAAVNVEDGAQEEEISPQQAQQLAKEDFVAANEVAEATEGAAEGADEVSPVLDGAEEEEPKLEEQATDLQAGEGDQQATLGEEAGEEDLVESGEAEEVEEGEHEDDAEGDEYTNGDLLVEEEDFDAEANGEEEYYDEEADDAADVADAEEDSQAVESAPSVDTQSRKRFMAPVEDDEDEEVPETKRSKVDGA